MRKMSDREVAIYHENMKRHHAIKTATAVHDISKGRTIEQVSKLTGMTVPEVRENLETYTIEEVRGGVKKTKRRNW